MSATLQVHGTFLLGRRSLFVVRGIVLDGAVAAGQRVASPVGIDAPVASVEAGLRSVSGGPAQTALLFRYGSASEVAAWQALLPAGTALSLADAAPAAGTAAAR